MSISILPTIYTYILYIHTRVTYMYTYIHTYIHTLLYIPWREQEDLAGRYLELEAASNSYELHEYEEVHPDLTRTPAVH